MKSCRRNFPAKPIITETGECICQGLCLMKEFRLKHTQKECSFKDITGSTYKTKEFTTGSSYEGEWKHGSGMHGHGVYKFRNGVIYEGEFKDGAMHGEGELRYQTKTGTVLLRGRWENDIMIKKKIIFNGFIEYNEQDWKYCMMPDRRYFVECDIGLQPSGDSFLTSYKPRIKIPKGYYDVGDGFYEPNDKMVYTYDLSQSVRRPSEREQKWIIENCRYGDKTPLGPRSDLYETFLEPTMKLAPEPPPEIRRKSLALRF